MNELSDTSGSPERIDKIDQLEFDKKFHEIYTTLYAIASQYGTHCLNSKGELWGYELASPTEKFSRPDWLVFSSYGISANPDDLAHVILSEADDADGTPTQLVCFLIPEGESTGRIKWYHERARYTEENGQKVWCDGEDLSEGDDLSLEERRALLERIQTEIRNTLE
jgi:hypothetical protein